MGFWLGGVKATQVTRYRDTCLLIQVARWLGLGEEELDQGKVAETFGVVLGAQVYVGTLRHRSLPMFFQI